jgi:hypothetical protein
MNERLKNVFDDIHTLHRNKCTGELFTHLLKAKEVVEKLQKQSDLLTLGLLQEKQKTSALLEACEKALRLLQLTGKGDMVNTPAGEMLIIVIAAAKKE